MKLAEVYEQTDRKALAIDQYRKVFFIEPAIFVNQPTLSEVHRYINIYDVFKKELDDRIQTNPNNPRDNMILAKIFQAQGHYGKSANILRKVLTQNPNNNEAKILLAQIQKYTQ